LVGRPDKLAIFARLPKSVLLAVSLASAGAGFGSLGRGTSAADEGVGAVSGAGTHSSDGTGRAGAADRRAAVASFDLRNAVARRCSSAARVSSAVDVASVAVGWAAAGCSVVIRGSKRGLPRCSKRDSGRDSVRCGRVTAVGLLCGAGGTVESSSASGAGA